MQSQFVLPEILRGFIGASQLAALEDALHGERAAFFEEKLTSLAERIESMPDVYGQDGRGGDAIVYLHYTAGSRNWWITEKNLEPGQWGAYGYADHGTCSLDLVDIPLEELTEAGAEIDLYWKPVPLREVKAETATSSASTEE
jgi:hypothetical protein